MPVSPQVCRSSFHGPLLPSPHLPKAFNIPCGPQPDPHPHISVQWPQSPPLWLCLWPSSHAGFVVHKLSLPGSLAFDQRFSRNLPPVLWDPVHLDFWRSLPFRPRPASKGVSTLSPTMVRGSGLNNRFSERLTDSFPDVNVSATACFKFWHGITWLIEVWSCSSRLS